MLYIAPVPNTNNNYPIAILIKEAALIESEIMAHYVRPLEKLGMKKEDFIFVALPYNEVNKVPVSMIKESLKDILPNLAACNTKTLLVADGHYFKTLTKMRTAEPHHGYIKPCAIPSYEYLDVILSVNYQGLFYNPAIQEKLDMSLTTLNNFSAGNHIDLGVNVIHSEHYPDTLVAIKSALTLLHNHPEITCDIEGYGLDLATAGVATISFAWDKHNGIAFLVDMGPTPGKVRKLLQDFFTAYTGKITYHGGAYDIRQIIFNIFMHDFDDTAGLLRGLEVMYRNIDDTKIITYLATNTTAGNKLSLKHVAFEYTGNYAQDDIKDITKIPKDNLLRYNLTDALATWYAKEKYWDVMVADKQLDIYNTMMKPSMKIITHMELNGMPMDRKQIDITWDKLNKKHKDLQTELHDMQLIKDFELLCQKEAMLKKNLTYVSKVATIDDFTDQYNPASPKQTAKLIFEYLDYPVIDLTKTKLPATGAKTLTKLLNKLKFDDKANKTHIRLLEVLIEIAEVSIIITTFLAPFREKTVQKSDGCWYLFGNFNLGGTLSGRLSSSNVNLQNLPSTGSRYAKDIKLCFIAPLGWIMMGADFDSLEDKVSALTTKDPNKLKVYTDGYDGHCLRAYSYFGDQMPDIINTVDSINSIKVTYPVLRQESKGPTFCLTYQGTFKALIGLGFSPEAAYKIESNYHDLYKVSDEWVQGKLIEASKVGYTTVAFGLRLRTPILGQCIINTKSTPYEAQAEGRTVGNAQGQSYGLLNNRAAIALHEKLLKSEFSHDIKPISHIHDAQYFIVRDNLDAIKWLNDNLPKEMLWQELPELKHPSIKLGGECSVFYPNWAGEITLGNDTTKREIYDRVHTALKEREAA